VIALRRYAAVWRLPGAPTLVVAGVLGRLPIGMTPLALVLLVRDATGSYAAAGAVSALYGIATALAGPLLGRLSDRVGPARVLLVTASAYPVAVAGVLAAVWGHRPAWVIAVAAALLGAVLPPLTAAVRSVWTDLTDPAGAHLALRGPALALETTVFEVVFVVGPMLVGGLVATPGDPGVATAPRPAAHPGAGPRRRARDAAAAVGGVRPGDVVRRRRGHRAGVRDGAVRCRR
jgi:MFS family permease